MSTYYNPIHDIMMAGRYYYPENKPGSVATIPAPPKVSENTVYTRKASTNSNTNTNPHTTQTTYTGYTSTTNNATNVNTTTTAATHGGVPHDLSPKKKLLSTSSPEGIQVASKITPTRLANLLIRKGPLPIRHITSQLAIEVPSFDLLSLSKQRRLIMAAMEQTDTHNNVVFEKIGWGQWAVRKVDSDYIVTEGTEQETPSASSDRMVEINVHDLRNQTNLKLGWTKKQPRRRESISSKANLHNTRLPNEQQEHKMEDSVAIASDSSDDELSDPMEHDNEDEPMFDFEEDKKSPPITFAKRVPLKLSPPPGERARRRSSSSNPNSINKNNYRQIFNRSRLNSLDNLDGYIRSSAKNSSISVTSKSPNISSVLSVSPPLGNNYVHSNTENRRKSSFNESHLRSTLSSSLPKQSTHMSITNLLNKDVREEKEDKDGDTDEEDWASIGAESLRRKEKEVEEEREAATALVDLRSV